MGAVAQLSHATIDVEPGRSATFAITVRNTGTVVDRFSFEALGTVAPWVTFAPATLSLFPEASGTVNVILAPPHDPTVTAGALPLGVRVSSSEDAAGTFVEETTVNVAAFSDISVELVPRVARGRVMGRTQLAVDNRSNCTYRAELSGTDPQGLLTFSFRPTLVDITPGAAAFVKVGLRPRHRFWRGVEKTLPFQLTLTNDPVAIPVWGQTPAAEADTPAQAPAGSPPGGPAASGSLRGSLAPTPPAGTPVSAGTAVAAPRPSTPHRDEIPADGSMLQGPLLPRWLLGPAAALVGLAVLRVILWYALFRPQIHSTAQNEVNKQLAANGITPVSPTGGAKTGTTGSASSGGSGQTGSGTSSGSAGTGTGGAAGGGATSLGAGGTINKVRQASGNGTYLIFAVPKGRTLQVTDLLVENSAGDVGNLTLALNGAPVMQWAMANFRDLDYHWITPTVFGPGSQVQMIVSGCTGACTPAIYTAGHLVSG